AVGKHQGIGGRGGVRRQVVPGVGHSSCKGEDCRIEELMESVKTTAEEPTIGDKQVEHLSSILQALENAELYYKATHGELEIHNKEKMILLYNLL
uniref:Uncharacterized protein n=1 Tax=Romanomermis culicivorax TaxID=13658 RepID=A0A915IW97_ROMCU